MDRISLPASERTLLGKQVKNLRKKGQIPGHVYGKGLETEHVSVDSKTFLTVFKEAGETGLIDLKISKLASSKEVDTEKTRPVLIRGVDHSPVTGLPLNIDFYQVNLSVKVKVPVPLVLIGEEPEKVHLGEAIVLQTLSEIEVEALPTDFIEKIEIDITTLKEIDDVITVGQLNFDREKLSVGAGEDEVVVKLAPAVSAEMEALLEEQAAETAAAAEEATEEGAEGESASVEASADKEGESVETIEGEEEKPKEEDPQTITEN